MAKYKEWLKPEKLLLLEDWARCGLTDEQIANNIGINRDTLYTWKKKYTDISDTLKKGKEVVDIQVENALLKRALGYSYTEDKYMFTEMSDKEYIRKRDAFITEYKINNPEATKEEIEKVKISFSKTKKVLVEQKTKEITPDTTAQIFWLKNRKPDAWRDKQQIEHSGVIVSLEEKRQLALEEIHKKLKDNE